MSLTTLHAEEPAQQQDSLKFVLRDLAVGVLIVAALTLGVTLLLTQVARAQEKTELRIGYQKAASLFVLQKAQARLKSVF